MFEEVNEGTNYEAVFPILSMKLLRLEADSQEISKAASSSAKTY